jgi:hypothetical protein
MLLPDNIHPEKTIYYNGALVLQVLQNKKTQNILDLFQIVKIKHKMNFAVFLLCLDWLYLINIAIVNQKGEIELCT